MTGDSPSMTAGHVRLLTRPLPAHAPAVPLPPAESMTRVFAGAIAIGSTAAVVGAYYVTLAARFPPGTRGQFLVVLGALVGLSIGGVFLVHRRLSGRLVAWLRRPGDGVELTAWRQAINYPAHLSLAVGVSAVVVSLIAAGITALSVGAPHGAALGLHIAVGGTLAAILDAIFAWLYTDWATRPLRRAMAVRDPMLPVTGPGIVSLGLAAKMAIVIVGVSLVGSVVAGTLAYREAATAIASGNPGSLALHLVLVTAIGLAVSLSGCLLVTHHTTEPLRELTTLVTELNPERYTQRGVPMSADEVGHLMAAVNSMLGGLEERDFIKDAFSRYVTRQVSDVVLQGGLELGGELLTATILMADIRGFTSLSEHMPPRQVVRMLNRYFTEMVEECMEHGGMIDKFIGDAIMVVFGAPVRQAPEQSVLNAARAALGMQRRLERLNVSFAADGLPALRIGVGIHTGEAIAGNIGSPQRIDYTLIGDVVNTCARIESSCKDVGHDVLLSEASRVLLGERARVGEAQVVHLKGKALPSSVYPLFGLE